MALSRGRLARERVVKQGDSPGFEVSAEVNHGLPELVVIQNVIEHIQRRGEIKGAGGEFEIGLGDVGGDEIISGGSLLERGYALYGYVHAHQRGRAQVMELFG